MPLSVRRFGPVLAERKPLGEEPAVIGREAVIEHTCGADAVGAEMAEAIAQLAPCGDHRDIDIERQRDRPDRALGKPALGVLIADRDLAL